MKKRHLLRALVPLMWSLPFSAMAEDPAKVEFIRVDEDAAAARLQTALTRYEKDGVTVDLIGAIHIAAKEGQAPKNQPDPAKLLEAMLSGKSNLMKLEIVHTLGQGDDQIGALAGESVILTDRNARCLEVLAREIKAGTRNLGIFYGAAHFSHLSKQLEEQGFKRAHQEWLTAWDIPKPKKNPKEEPAQQPAQQPADEAKQAA